MEPSRFWLRRDDDDRARQVVFDEVQLDRYSDRQKRAILKVMARGKTSQRDISQAVRRARRRPRGEILVATILAASVLAVLIIVVANWRQGSVVTAASRGGAASQGAVDDAPGASREELTTVIENADRAWLSDVGAGKVVSARDGSDALTLPRVSAPAAASDEAATAHRRQRRP